MKVTGLRNVQYDSIVSPVIDEAKRKPIQARLCSFDPSGYLNIKQSLAA